MPKIKIDIPFTWWDKVKINTYKEETVTGIITEIRLTDKDVKYMVASGINDKECYAEELELLEPRKNEK
jgi:hypothetical protein